MGLPQPQSGTLWIHIRVCQNMGQPRKTPSIRIRVCLQAYRNPIKTGPALAAARTLVNQENPSIRIRVCLQAYRNYQFVLGIAFGIP